MTEVAFHFGVPDKIAYTCRLLRKAEGRGARVVVLGDALSVQHLDEGLWALAPTDFPAHCAEGADESLMKRSAVLLVKQIPAALPHRQVLVNLGEQVPPGFDTFERVIEVVSLDEADRAQARGRWKRYVELGYAINRHDVALKGAN